jgi:hypothetical protein
MRLTFHQIWLITHVVSRFAGEKAAVDASVQKVAWPLTKEYLENHMNTN